MATEEYVDNKMTWISETVDGVEWNYGISDSGHFVAGFYGSHTPSSIATWSANSINYFTFSVTYPPALANLISGSHTPVSVSATWGTALAWATATSHSSTGFSVRIMGSGAAGTAAYYRGTVIC